MTEFNLGDTVRYIGKSNERALDIEGIIAEIHGNQIPYKVEYGELIKPMGDFFDGILEKPYSYRPFIWARGDELELVAPAPTASPSDTITRPAAENKTDREA